MRTGGRGVGCGEEERAEGFVEGLQCLWSTNARKGVHQQCCH